MLRRRGRALFALAATVAVIAAAGCGRDDFENDPRPTVPAEVSVEVGEDAVVVSHGEFGAGLVVFTIANLGDKDASVSFEGPTTAESDEIPPGGTTQLKTEVTTGDYAASVNGADAQPFEFEVGPERPSGQDELLLP